MLPVSERDAVTAAAAAGHQQAQDGAGLPGRLLHGLDAYARKLTPSSLQGGAVTLGVWAACAAYGALLFLQARAAPPVKTVGTEWTLGAGPFPLNVTCAAPSGCYVTNLVDAQHTLGVSEAVPAEERSACAFLAEGAWKVLHLAYSMLPSHGVQAYWRGEAERGLTLQSQIRCLVDAPGCVALLDLPVGAGGTLLNHVQTANATAAGAARSRHEWFVSSLGAEGVPVAAACAAAVADVGWHQAHLQLNSMYNTVHVEPSLSLMGLLGAVGGGYATFLTAGAAALALVNAVAARAQARPQQQQHQKYADNPLFRLDSDFLQRRQP